VFDEAAEGDPDRAAERLELLRRTTWLPIPEEAFPLRFQLLARAALPHNAVLDALHIAIAAVHEIDYLATWNCKHIANAVSLRRVYDICRRAGYEPPIICTPHELMGPDYEGI